MARTRSEGGETVTGTMNVTGATDLDGTLNVDGVTTLAGTTVTGSVTVTQSSLGSAVQSLSSTATNDDPTETVYQNRVATTNATVTTIHTLAIPASTTVVIHAIVVGRRTGGASGVAEDSYLREFVATYKNVAGTATQVGFTGLAQHADSAIPGASATPSAANVLIQVQGNATTNIVWHLHARVYSVSS